MDFMLDKALLLFLQRGFKEQRFAPPLPGLMLSLGQTCIFPAGFYPLAK